MRSIIFATVLAVTGTGPAFGQDSGLSASDQRRMSFYSEKIVGELHALAAAEQAGSTSAYNDHRDALSTITERYVLAANKVGLDEDGAEKFFREYFAAHFTGRIPADFANDIGLVSIASLVSGLEKPTDETAAAQGGDYVDSIRAVGNLTFDND